QLAHRSSPAFPTRRSSDLQQDGDPEGEDLGVPEDDPAELEPRRELDDLREGAGRGAREEAEVELEAVAERKGDADGGDERGQPRSEEHTSELQSRENLVCR